MFPILKEQDVMFAKFMARERLKTELVVKIHEAKKECQSKEAAQAAKFP